jgi:hypothetical protein
VEVTQAVMYIDRVPPREFLQESGPAGSSALPFSNGPGLLAND